MIDNELPTECPSCTVPHAVLDQFLFQSGTADAHVRWVCVACGEGDGRVVPPESVFKPDDVHAYRIS